MAEQERLCGDTHLHVALAKLNLPPDVTYADAKRRYHALVKKLHPDKSNDDGTRAADIVRRQASSEHASAR